MRAPDFPDPKHFRQLLELAIRLGEHDKTQYATMNSEAILRHRAKRRQDTLEQEAQSLAVHILNQVTQKVRTATANGSNHIVLMPIASPDDKVNFWASDKVEQMCTAIGWRTKYNWEGTKIILEWDLPKPEPIEGKTGEES